MISIDYKKLILGLLIGSTVAVGMSPPAIGLTQREYEIACYEPVQPGARVSLVAKLCPSLDPDGEWDYLKGVMADLNTQDLESLQSRTLTYVANRLLLPEPERNGISSEPFIVPTRYLGLESLRALLLKSDLRNITCDLVIDAVRLADYLCLHDPKVLSEIYNRPEEGQLSRFLKGLAESNMPVLAEYYGRLLDAGQPEGAQELERFILPYIPYRLSSRGRLGEVGNADPARGHTDLVSSVALSPDGNTLVSGSDDRTVIVWRKDAAGGWQISQRLGRIHNEDPAQGHTDGVYSVVVSADGNTLVSGSADKTIMIWRKDAAGGWQMGQWLGEVGNDDPARGHRSYVFSVALSPDSNTLASGSYDCTIIIWRKDAAGRWQMGQRLGEVDNEDPARGHTNNVSSVALSPDGNTLVSGSWDRTVIVWCKDAETGEWQMVQRLGEVLNRDPERVHTDWVRSVVVSADGNTLVSGSDDRRIIIWRKDAAGRWQLGQRLGEVDNEDPARGHTNNVSSVALSPDGNTLVSGSADNTIMIWRKDAAGQWQMGQRLGEVDNEDPAQGHTYSVYSVAVSADGNTLVSGSDDRRIMIWRKDVLAYCRSQRTATPAVPQLGDIPEFTNLQRPVKPLEIVAWWGRLRAWVRR